MLLVTCPHCQTLVEVLSINCAIFRCGIYRVTGQQVPPHAPKEECDRLAASEAIWGCGKPFRVVPVQGTQGAEGGFTAEVCDYI